MSQSKIPITVKDAFFDDPFFKSNRQHFDNIGENMFKESKDIWKHFDNEFYNMDSSMSSNKVESSNASHLWSHREGETTTMKKNKKSGWMIPRKWMLKTGSNNGLTQLDLFKRKDSEVLSVEDDKNKEDINVEDDKDREIISVKDDKEKFEVSLDTSQYKPDELRVSVKEGIISVKGKHEEKSEDRKKMVSREFSRIYSLPAGTKAENVVSNLSSDGILVISAPKKKAIVANRKTDK